MTEDEIRRAYYRELGKTPEEETQAVLRAFRFAVIWSALIVVGVCAWIFH